MVDGCEVLQNRVDVTESYQERLMKLLVLFLHDHLVLGHLVGHLVEGPEGAAVEVDVVLLDGAVLH